MASPPSMPLPHGAQALPWAAGQAHLNVRRASLRQLPACQESAQARQLRLLATLVLEPRRQAPISCSSCGASHDDPTLLHVLELGAPAALCALQLHRAHAAVNTRTAAC